MVAARRENRSTAQEVPQVAIKNRTFLSILRALISFSNLQISAFRDPTSFKFIIARRRKPLNFRKNSLLLACVNKKLLMTHALVSADSRRAGCNFSANFKLKNELGTHFERNSPNLKKTGAKAVRV